MTMKIPCPHCGRIHSYDYEDMYFVDEESASYQCVSCDNEFVMVCDVTPTWDVFKNENDEEETFSKLDGSDRDATRAAAGFVREESDND